MLPRWTWIFLNDNYSESGLLILVSVRSLFFARFAFLAEANQIIIVHNAVHLNIQIIHTCHSIIQPKGYNKRHKKEISEVRPQIRFRLTNCRRRRWGRERAALLFLPVYVFARNLGGGAASLFPLWWRLDEVAHHLLIATCVTPRHRSWGRCPMWGIWWWEVVGGDQSSSAAVNFYSITSSRFLMILPYFPALRNCCHSNFSIPLISCIPQCTHHWRTPQ